MQTGLVVGKFCPLHKGHLALIAFAQAHCDRLVILSYSKPEFPGCEPQRRAAWLHALYPDAIRLVLHDDMLASFAVSASDTPRALPENDAPDAEHRVFVAWVCQTILGLTVDRVFTSAAYGDGFAETLAKSFGHPVQHLVFDMARTAIPISGTQLRSDPAAFRDYAAAPVLASSAPLPT